MNRSVWQYSTIHYSPCKIIEEQNLWGNIVYRILLPNQDTVVRAGFKKAWHDRDYSTIIKLAGLIPNNLLEEDPKLLM